MSPAGDGLKRSALSVFSGLSGNLGHCLLRSETERRLGLWQSVKLALLNGSTVIKVTALSRDKGGDVFVHFSALQGDGYRSLENDQKVEFTVADGEKGPQAQEVTVVT